MELRHQLAFLRSSLPLVILATVVSAVIAFTVSQVVPPTYEARVIVSVGRTTETASGDLNALQVSQRLSQTYAALAVTNLAARDIIEELGLDTTSDELLRRVRAEAPLESTLLTITVEDGDPVAAARIANAFADRMVRLDIPTVDSRSKELQAFIEADLKIVRAQIERIRVQVDALAAIEEPTAAERNERVSLESQVATLRSTFATLLSLSRTPDPGSSISIADPATVPLAPVSPRILINLVLGAILGMVIGIVLAYTKRRLDDTIRTPEELESVADLPVLGTIVQMPGDARRPLLYRLATLLYPRSPAAEGFRHVRTGVDIASGDTGLGTLLVTSAMPGDGKTTFAANLAVAFAQAGRTVCLVDADMRKPELHTMFSLPNEAGLSELLRGLEFVFETVTRPVEVEGLRVLTSGLVPANPSELIASPRMRAILASLSAEVDLVVLDSPPLQAVTDAAILASVTDGTILVAAAGKTRRALLLRARDTLSRVGARVLGTALNGIDQREGEDSAFGYFSYYGVAEPQERSTTERTSELPGS